jgi:hypothetical protein
MSRNGFKSLSRVLLVTACIAFLTAAGCSGKTDSNGKENTASNAQSDVAGTVRGTDVTLANATFDGDLAIFDGDGWGFNPSVLVFLFLDEGEIPAGREIVVNADDGIQMGQPHVHYRWRDPTSGEISSEALVEGYDMKLIFGQARGDILPGKIEFSVDGEATRRPDPEVT